jgi:hypothetical protein
MQYSARFKVQSKFLFPIDMLRYDGCIPASEQNSYRIANTMTWEGRQTAKVETGDGSVVIELRKSTTNKHWKPTEGRWNSFNWAIVPGSFTIEKV